jgi:hypothetical protein
LADAGRSRDRQREPLADLGQEGPGSLLPERDFGYQLLRTPAARAALLLLHTQAAVCGRAIGRVEGVWLRV